MSELFEFSTFQDNIALIEDTKEEMSYRQLQEAADTLKSHLCHRVLTFCLCSNTISSIVGYVAFIQENIPTLLLDANKDDELLQNLIDIYQPMYIWGPEDKNLGQKIFRYKGYSLSKCHETAYTLHDKLALLLTTSGSTGSPKLVRLTEENILSNAESIIQYLGITPKERAVTSLPMYYSFGMSVINSHLHIGATLLLTNAAIIQKDFWNFVKDYSATSLSGVPYTYETLRRLRFFRMNLPKLTTLIQAGGKLNAEIVKEYIEQSQNCGKRFIVMYGQTEAAPRMSYLPFDKALEKYSSIGIAIPGGKFHIKDDHDTEITKPFVDGELVYEGSNVCMGYANCIEDLSKGDENSGVLYTGDIAHFDEDYFYYITGRKKRFVKIWGNRCNLDSIEQMVKIFEPECACVGEDNRIIIFIPKEGMRDAILKYLIEKTKFIPSVFTLQVIDQIPILESGKIDYKSLRLLSQL